MRRVSSGVCVLHPGHRRVLAAVGVRQMRVRVWTFAVSDSREEENREGVLASAWLVPVCELTLLDVWFLNIRVSLGSERTLL